MNFNYESKELRIGMVDANADEVLRILAVVLPDQAQIDKLAATVKGLTGRLLTSSTALQGAILKEN